MNDIIATILTEIMNLILLFVCIASVSYIAYKVFNYRIFDSFTITDDDDE